MADTRPAPREKLSTRVSSALRSRLLAGEVPPGHKLPSEAQLTEQFGVSRTVVREAIAALAADGLVESRQGAGVFVVNHPSSTFGTLAAEMGSKVSVALNVLEVRLAIEVESAALAAQRRNLSQQARIEEAFFEFEQLLRTGNATGPADFAFHRRIVDAAHSPTLSSVYAAISNLLKQSHMQRRLRISHVEGMETYLIDHHKAVLSALVQGDIDRADKLLTEHFAIGSDFQRRALIAGIDSA